ncbi:hypothetical protein [Wenjunlia tyrosinilytica]|uniref:Uncharacterized protein n=1 Tax=Wenjunlia tyrosinilytica TaxID=1544741 RepID=A0A917ZQ71_9ACTN|nr:hypothetical protein [Wenjunlia tyrosinilytica]GGO88494.1 hypothetical protein GCM10012280_29450 [Wenjunlia tyrosinilytica]
MPALEASLSRLLDTPGLTGAALVDAVTGLSYGTAGDAGEAGDAVECSELTTLLAEGLRAAGAEGELESVIVTSRRRHHVSLLVRRQGDPLLLTAGFDRELTNLALTIRQMTDVAEDVLT